MFDFNDNPHSEALDKNIADLLEELAALTGSTDEYTTTAANLAKLMELKNQALKTGNESDKIENDRAKMKKEEVLAEEEVLINQRKITLDETKFAAEKEKELSWKPSPDAAIGAAASIIGILFVLHYEKAGVIASKALGFIGKLKN